MADIPASEREADPTTDLVPFGKYRGRPVTDLIADRNYVEWLLAQSWFADRQRPIYNLIIGSGGPEPQDTPEHNAMQARYLDEAPCLAIAHRFLPNEKSLRSAVARNNNTHLTDQQRANLTYDDSKYMSAVCDVQFEVDGWDVTFSGLAWLTGPKEVTPTSEGDSQGLREKYGGRCHCCSVPYLYALRSYQEEISVCVELKPTIGDDFPSILRSVVKRNERFVARGTWGWGTREGRAIVVVADRITPSSVSVDQVRTMFQSRSVHLFTTDELS